jgi:hypothetical protein
MTRKRASRAHKRDGAILILVVVMVIPLLAMVAFAVDYGYLLKVRTDLQRTADSAALAAVQDLIPASDGTQDLDAVRATVRAYAASNTGSAFQVLDADIEIGRFDPDLIYSQVTLLNTGVFDAVRVTVRRDAQANSPVSLFFARALGIQGSAVTATATAVLQKATTLGPGADVLPFAVPVHVWSSRKSGDVWSIFGDGRLADENGTVVTGNWGTVDIGSTTNSTSDLRDQINDGLRQVDLDALYVDGRIPANTHIDSTQQMWVNGDPGISAGMQSAVQAAHGTKRLVPLYDALGGEFHGSHVEVSVVGWGVVTVVDSHWGGSKNTRVDVEKSFSYFGELCAQGNLSLADGAVEGAFTSPVLVE